MAADLVLRARRVVVGDGEAAAAVVVADGRVASVEAFDAAPPRGVEVVTLADDEVLLPGLVDTHVHVNEPGRTEWEGFASATRAAAAGGVTTVVDMPLNSIPPTVTVPALAEKRRAASGQAHVDVAFWGGAVPGNVPDLEPLHAAGVVGFKAFLVDSGVPEFGHLDDTGLRAALEESARLGTVLALHAEDHDVLALAPAPSGRGYAGYLASRPPAAEQRAVERVVAALRDVGGRAHVVHVSAAAVVPVLAAARAEGLALTAETCPHYLSLCAETVPDGATQFKCCPPIRGRTDREALWAALATGAIGLVVSDHSPCTADLKALGTGDFGAAWGGIAGLQLGLPLVWTEARAPRPLPGRRGPVDGGGSGRPRGAGRPGPDRPRGRGAPRRVRPRRGAHRRRPRAAPQEPRVPVLRTHPQGRGPADLAARQPGRPRRRTPRAAHRKRKPMTGPHYYVPRGGLPAQGELTTDRARFTTAYAVLPRGTMRDIVTSRLPHWSGTRLWVLARPLSGFAETFSWYVVEVQPGGGSESPEPDPAAEAVLFVVAGTAALTEDGVTHELVAGSYAFLPPGHAWTLLATGGEPAVLHWIRKAYDAVAGVERAGGLRHARVVGRRRAHAGHRRLGDAAVRGPRSTCATTCT